jgi:hypothetical protein
MSDTDKAIISESYINILEHRVAELEAENKMLKQLAKAEAMSAVKTEHSLVFILIAACKKTEIGREALREWDLARTAKGE